MCPSGSSSFTIWANYKTANRFSIGFTLSGMSTLNAPDKSVIPCGFAQNPQPFPSFNGTSLIMAGIDGSFVCTSSNDSVPWMAHNLNWLGDRSLRHICLPGSHDSGMNSLTHHTAFSTERNTVTQWRDIGGQLRLGVRNFDIRPCRWSSDFYAGHFSYVGKVAGFDVNWQGGTGQPIRDIVSQINDFTAHNPE